MCHQLEEQLCESIISDPLTDPFAGIGVTPPPTDSQNLAIAHDDQPHMDPTQWQM